MGRARQIASAENRDTIILDGTDGTSADAGDHLLLDASAASTDVGFFLNTEVGTTETPPEGFVNTSSLAANAVDNTKIASEAVKLENLAEETTDTTNRNVIINGSMNVHQRGPANQTGLGASSAYVIDRFEIDSGGGAARLTRHRIRQCRGRGGGRRRSDPICTASVDRGGGGNARLY